MSSSESTTVSQISHSLNEIKIESKEDNYRRDSFDDRFCDDLCEDILQYLAIKDKLRLECVSKQFQRTVTKKVYELDLDDSQVSVAQILYTLAEKFHRLNCFEKLKSLSIVFMNSDLRLLFPVLKTFPALKRLDLWTDIDKWWFDEEPVSDEEQVYDEVNFISMETNINSFHSMISNIFQISLI